MKNCTLLLLCIGLLIVVSYADQVENEPEQEVDSELVEDVLWGWCSREGRDCNKRRCCRRLKCDNTTKKCVKEPCKTEGQECRTNKDCCKETKCSRKEKKCVKKADLIPEEFLEVIGFNEDFDEDFDDEEYDEFED